jgi:hypothetical protein
VSYAMDQGLTNFTAKIIAGLAAAPFNITFLGTVPLREVRLQAPPASNAYIPFHPFEPPDRGYPLTYCGREKSFIMLPPKDWTDHDFLSGLRPYVPPRLIDEKLLSSFAIAKGGLLHELGHLANGRYYLNVDSGPFRPVTNPVYLEFYDAAAAEFHEQELAYTDEHNADKYSHDVMTEAGNSSDWETYRASLVWSRFVITQKPSHSDLTGPYALGTPQEPPDFIEALCSYTELRMRVAGEITRISLSSLSSETMRKALDPFFDRKKAGKDHELMLTASNCAYLKMNCMHVIHDPDNLPKLARAVQKLSDSGEISNPLTRRMLDCVRGSMAHLMPGLKLEPAPRAATVYGAKPAAIAPRT